MQRQLRSMKTLSQFGIGENLIGKYLKGEINNNNNNEIKQTEVHKPRRVMGCHYTTVYPELFFSIPYKIAASKSCAIQLQLDVNELNNLEFANYFVGNKLLPGLDQPYCTVYGCHCYGQWFGQLGDGRAITIGDVFVEKNPSTSSVTANDEHGQEADYIDKASIEDEQMEDPNIKVKWYELQLKGSGRSPFSRGFDGRAVVRSSVREYLASEAMYHLGVPTTRALSLIGTGETVRRPWYAATSTTNQYGEDSSSPKFPPDMMQREPGAVLCRVSRSFLRFSHLELFAIRQEYEELQQMMDYVCLREYPILLQRYPSPVTPGAALEINSIGLPSVLTPGPPERYLALYRKIGENVAHLVTEWLRVGYVQGNMNSDNTLLSGRTLDYGPYGWMERFDPLYQPFTSDSDGKFCFIRQPQAMAVNFYVLGQSAFEVLIHQLCVDAHSTIADQYVKELQTIAQKEYSENFQRKFNEMRRKKLGFKRFEASSDEQTWSTLLHLLTQYEVDYTIFFRELSKVTMDMSIKDAYEVVEVSMGVPSKAGFETWTPWLTLYLQRLKRDGRLTRERQLEQNTANPKYILRNWMSALAYERAIKHQDYGIIEELTTLLSNPYDEQPSMEEKWYQKTPDWAKGLPGVAFMS